VEACSMNVDDKIANRLQELIGLGAKVLGTRCEASGQSYVYTGDLA
jgi:hypothetical protein